MNNKILLSIKPNFVSKIISGEKKFEFRKVIPKNKSIDTVVIYASSPVCKVIGEFKIKQILSGSPKDLWLKTYEFSGISEDYFNSYFQGKNIGYALAIKEFILYDKPKLLKDITNIKAPPQSFYYL